MIRFRVDDWGDTTDNVSDQMTCSWSNTETMASQLPFRTS